MKKNNECAICKNHKDFSIDEELVDAFIAGDVVVFAGAGISTENKTVFPFTFYDEMKLELGLDEAAELSFPELASMYEKKKGRINLIQAIRKRLNYVESYPELYRSATIFHKTLSSIPMINEIITTNWDEYFENECGAFSYVDEKDILFWDTPARRVLKIHGSVNNISSIVITEKDYRDCEKRLNSGLLGSRLKLLLANKTLIFIGYSFGDDDFNQIYSFIQKKVSNFSKKRYLVIPNKRDEEILSKLNLIPVYTDGTYFLEKIRDEIAKKSILLSSEKIGIIEVLLHGARWEHDKASKYIVKNLTPDLFYCLSYQDGVIHALEYLLNNLKTGYTYSIPRIFLDFNRYEEFAKQKKKNKKWWDYAYIEGYMLGLFLVINLEGGEYHEPEFYYNVFTGHAYPTLGKFKKSYLEKRKNEKSILIELNKIKKKYPISSRDIIFHHTPFLF